MNTSETKFTGKILILPAILLFILGVACINEGDAPSSIVSLSFAITLFVISWFSKDPIVSPPKNTYSPKKYTIYNHEWKEIDFCYQREEYDCQDDPEQDI
mgnify:CR=1 FL=1